MTPTQAAKVIGCSPGQVRTLIRTGKIQATVYAMPGGIYYDITPREVNRYKTQPQKQGWPRGQSRRI